jgi:hypothetical protein
MIRLSLFALGVFAFLPALRAADAPKPPAYELKNRSTFAVDRNSRAPFWPIGWRKELGGVVKTTQAPVVKAFQIQPHHFNVTSVLAGNPPVAIINGRGFGEGEPLPVIVGDLPVQVIVRQIRDGGVWLEQGAHRIFVPQRREKLAPRQNSDVDDPKDQFKIQIQDK